MLAKFHKENHVKWAEARVTWGTEKWNKVISSDGKKFNLDGPDGLQCYWHDLRWEKEYFSRCQSGGGLVMIWGAFSYNQSSEMYVDTLLEFLLPFAHLEYGTGFVFRQDGAIIHLNGNESLILGNGY